jgi:hypothetical protein
VRRPASPASSSSKSNKAPLKPVIDLHPVYTDRKEQRIRAHILLSWLALLAWITESACYARWPAPRARLDRGRHLHRRRGRPAAHRDHQGPAPHPCPAQHQASPRIHQDTPPTPDQHEDPTLDTRHGAQAIACSGTSEPDSPTIALGRLWNPGRRELEDLLHLRSEY